MNDLVLLSCSPVDGYFLWQYQVLITNARKYNLSGKMVILVWYPEHRKEELKQWDTLIKEGYPEVSIYYYQDEGVDLGLYIPQLRPHTIKKYFKEFGEYLQDKTFFYHDSDILFTRELDFKELIKGDICYQSDTSSYLDYSYLRVKEIEGNIPEEKVIKILADIGEISVETIKSYNGNTGGAQSILKGKGIDYEFWEDVESMSIAIRSALWIGTKGSVNDEYFPSEDKGFQSWAADMWALNFALWKRGMKTEVTPLLDFSWGSNNIEVYKSKPIFHLAGVSSSKDFEFYKAEWIDDSPIGNPNLKEPREDSATYAYWLAIKEVEGNEMR